MVVSPGELRTLSLCSGGGGLDLGFGLAVLRARTVCYVEREAFAAARLVEAMAEGLLDDAPLWSDIATFDCEPWRGVVDCVIGGWPCQPYSAAGKRRGAADERDLWPEVLRIVTALRPRLLFGENVSRFASDPDGLDRCSRDLAGIGNVPLFPPGPGAVDAWRRILELDPSLAPALEPPFRLLADGLAADRRHWLRLLGNGVVPLQAAYAVCALLAGHEVSA